MRSIVLIALLSISCYQTTTSDGRTTRTNTVTGRTEILVRDGAGNPTWREVAAAEPARAVPTCAPEDPARPSPGLKPDTLRRLGYCR